MIESNTNSGRKKRKPAFILYEAYFASDTQNIGIKEHGIIQPLVLNKEGDNAFFTQFEGGQTAETRVALNHYLAGLAYEGLGDKAKAKAEYSETLKINPGHIWSKVHMESL